MWINILFITLLCFYSLILEPLAQNPELVTQVGHVSSVMSVAFSQDRKMLASGGWDFTIKLWNVETGQVINTFEGHKDRVNSVAISPKGNFLASASNDKTVKLWDLKTGKLFKTIEYKNEAESVTFSPNGELLAIGNLDTPEGGSSFDYLYRDKTIELRNGNNGSLINSYEGGDVHFLKFLSDNKTLGISSDGTAGNGIWLLNTENDSQKVLLRFYPYETRIDFSEDGRNVALINSKQEIEILDVQSKHPKRIIRDPGSVNSLAFSSNGETLAHSSSDNAINIWRVNDGKPIGKVLKGHSDSVDFMTFSKDGFLLASGSSDATIKLWNLKKLKEIRTLRGNILPSSTLAFSKQGNKLALGSNNFISLWDLSNSSPPTIFKAHDSNVSAIAFSPDGSILASGGYDKTIKLWDKEKLAKKLEGNKEGILSLAFSPKGNLLVSGGGRKEEGELILWNLQTKKMEKNLVGHKSFINSISFSIDGNVLATGSSDDESNDGNVKLWNVQTWEAKSFSDYVWKHVRDVNSVAFSPDGNLMASASSDRNINICDAKTGKPLYHLGGYEERFRSVAFSVDNKLVAGGADNSNIIFWNFEKGIDYGPDKKILQAHNGSVMELAFLPNNLLLSIGGGFVKLWHTDSKELALTLLLLENKNWLVTTPDGFFDGTPEAQKQILWKLNNNTVDVVPVEAFYYEYFYPGLLQKVLAGGTLQFPQGVKSLNQKDIRQAGVKLFDADCLSKNAQLRSSHSLSTPRFETELCLEITASPNFSVNDFADLNLLIHQLVNHDHNGISKNIFSGFSAKHQKELLAFVNQRLTDEQKIIEIKQILRQEFNSIVRDLNFYQNNKASLQPFINSQEIKELISLIGIEKDSGEVNNLREILNRKLLEIIYHGLIKSLEINNSRHPTQNNSTKGDKESALRQDCEPNEPCLQDMRLFWNGRLMKRWYGDLAKYCHPVTFYRLQCETKVPLIKGENKYTAYLFNQDRVKSFDGEILITKNK